MPPVEAHVPVRARSARTCTLAEIFGKVTEPKARSPSQRSRVCRAQGSPQHPVPILCSIRCQSCAEQVLWTTVRVRSTVAQAIPHTLEAHVEHALQERQEVQYRVAVVVFAWPFSSSRVS